MNGPVSNQTALLTDNIGEKNNAVCISNTV